VIDPFDPGTLDIEQLVTPGIAAGGPTWQAMHRSRARRCGQTDASPPLSNSVVSPASGDDPA